MNYDKSYEAYAKEFGTNVAALNERTRRAVEAAVDAAFGEALAPGTAKLELAPCVCPRMFAAAYSNNASLSWVCPEHGALTMDARPLPAPEVRPAAEPRFPRRGERA